MTDDPRLRELEEKYEDHKVYDNAGEKIGKVDDLFVDEAAKSTSASRWATSGSAVRH